MIYPLFPIINQFQLKNGALNVGGFLRVCYAARTDVVAASYADSEGTVLNPEWIVLDNNARAKVYVDVQFAYNLYVYDSKKNLLWTQYTLLPDSIAEITVTGMQRAYVDDTLSGTGLPTSPLGLNRDSVINQVYTDNTILGNGTSAHPIGVNLDKIVSFSDNGNISLVNSGSFNQGIYIRPNGYSDGTSDIGVWGEGFAMEMDGTPQHKGFWDCWESPIVENEISVLVNPNDVCIFEGRDASVSGRMIASLTGNTTAISTLSGDVSAISANISGKADKSDFTFVNNYLTCVSGKDISAANAGYAKCAEKDSYGNNIATTYVKKNDLDSTFYSKYGTVDIDNKSFEATEFVVKYGFGEHKTVEFTTTNLPYEEEFDWADSIYVIDTLGVDIDSTIAINRVKVKCTMFFKDDTTKVFEVFSAITTGLNRIGLSTSSPCRLNKLILPDTTVPEQLVQNKYDMIKKISFIVTIEEQGPSSVGTASVKPVIIYYKPARSVERVALAADVSGNTTAISTLSGDVSTISATVIEKQDALTFGYIEV